MSPYRTPAPLETDARARESSVAEGLVMGLLWLLVGAVPIGLAVAHHAHWGWEPSVGLLFAVFGAWCLAIEARRVRRRRRAQRRPPTLKEIRKWTRSS